MFWFWSRPRLVRAAYGCSLAALFACAASTPAPESVPEPLVAAQLGAQLGEDFELLNGRWDSNYGAVQLMFEDDGSFQGVYRDGTLRGQVDADAAALTFEWEDDFGCGRGRFEIVDLDTLRGTWGRADSSANGGAWTLVR